MKQPCEDLPESDIANRTSGQQQPRPQQQHNQQLTTIDNKRDVRNVNNNNEEMNQPCKDLPKSDIANRTPGKARLTLKAHNVA